MIGLDKTTLEVVKQLEKYEEDLIPPQTLKIKIRGEKRVMVISIDVPKPSKKFKIFESIMTAIIKVESETLYNYLK